jgi:hypothetical protein
MSARPVRMLATVRYFSHKKFSTILKTLLSLEPVNAAYVKKFLKSINHFNDLYVVLTSVADPDSGSKIRCLFDPWIRDPGSVKS